MTRFFMKFNTGLKWVTWVKYSSSPTKTCSNESINSSTKRLVYVTLYISNMLSTAIKRCNDGNNSYIKNLINVILLISDMLLIDTKAISGKVFDNKKSIKHHEVYLLAKYFAKKGGK